MSPEDAANYVRRFAVAALKMLEAPDVGALIAANLEIAELEGEKIPNLQQEVRFLSSENGTLKKQIESSLVEIDALKRELSELKSRISDSVFVDPDFVIDASVDFGDGNLIEIKVTTTNLAIPVLVKKIPAGEAAGLASMLNSCAAAAEGLTDDPVNVFGGN